MPHIKPENWAVLADSIAQALQHERDAFVALAVASFRRGNPEPDYITGVAQRLELMASRTYNGSQRRQCLSIVETMQNYGLLG